MERHDKHQSVLLTEAVNNLVTKPNGVYVDATFGRGGHARAILKKLDAKGLLIAIDKDPDAIRAAQTSDFSNDPRFTIRQASFADVLDIVKTLDFQGKVDGVLLDLGVSSPQLDDASRGFSFLRDGPLDMRMDTSQGMTAASWLASVDEKTLGSVFKEYGEERYAKRIARAIVSARDEKPIETTKQLADLIVEANPSKEAHKHPATRCFQAIRIFINHELDDLRHCLQQVLEVLAIGGRFVVISFHSLEDRIVKQFFKKQAKGMDVPRGLPILESEIHKTKRLKLLSRAIRPSEKEINTNPRARSATLRIAEKIA